MNHKMEVPLRTARKVSYLAWRMGVKPAKLVELLTDNALEAVRTLDAAKQPADYWEVKS